MSKWLKIFKISLSLESPHLTACYSQWFRTSSKERHITWEALLEEAQFHSRPWFGIIFTDLEVIFHYIKFWKALNFLRIFIRNKQHILLTEPILMITFSILNGSNNRNQCSKVYKLSDSLSNQYFRALSLQKVFLVTVTRSVASDSILMPRMMASTDRIIWVRHLGILKRKRTPNLVNILDYLAFLK